MSASKITELHDEAVWQKSMFSSKGRKGRNIGVMELDGKIYIANSSASSFEDPVTRNFRGDKAILVTMPKNSALKLLL